MAKRTKKLLQTEDYSDSTDSIRLNRFLSDTGACSRREADRLIEEGHVTVDGVKAELGMKITKDQTILLKGKPVKREEKLVLIALNKPRGIVCTTDRREKDNVIDFLKFDKRIYPIGRLDKDSEGLLLLTNDGSIVNKILRGGNNHEKEYVVTVDKPLTADFLKQMAEGVPILDTVTRPCTIKALDKYTFQIILTQGLNRQIRRMCEYLDFRVQTLKRTRVMNIHLGHLQTGGYRNITEKEITGLTEAIRDSVNTAESNYDSVKEARNERNNVDGKVIKHDTRKDSKYVNKKDYKTGNKTSNKASNKTEYNKAVDRDYKKADKLKDSKGFRKEDNKVYKASDNKNYRKEDIKDYRKEDNKNYKKEENKDYIKADKKEYKKEYRKEYKKEFSKEPHKDFNTDDKKDYNVNHKSGKKGDGKKVYRKDNFKERDNNNPSKNSISSTSINGKSTKQSGSNKAKGQKSNASEYSYPKTVARNHYEKATVRKNRSSGRR